MSRFLGFQGINSIFAISRPIFLFKGQSGYGYLFHFDFGP